MRMDTCRVPNLRYAAYVLKQSGFRLVAATEKVDNYIYNVDLTGPIAVIMGSEGKGISSAMLELADVKAAIPMAGEIGSLYWILIATRRRRFTGCVTSERKMRTPRWIFRSCSAGE